MSRSDVKFTVGQAHQIAKVLREQARPNRAQQDATHGWIVKLSANRSCKLNETECRVLSAVLRAVCQPVGVAQQKELTSIIKRLTPPTI